MLVDGKEYTTVEHWFQSQKFTDPALQERIRLISTPASARRLGKTRDPSFRSEWDTIKEDVMYKGLKAKFDQNIFLYTELLKTGSLELKEDSSWDSYWGLGRTGNGKNRLGVLVMKLRTEFS